MIGADQRGAGEVLISFAEEIFRGGDAVEFVEDAAQVEEGIEVVWVEDIRLDEEFRTLDEELWVIEEVSQVGHRDPVVDPEGRVIDAQFGGDLVFFQRFFILPCFAHLDGEGVPAFPPVPEEFRFDPIPIFDQELVGLGERFMRLMEVVVFSQVDGELNEDIA